VIGSFSRSGSVTSGTVEQDVHVNLATATILSDLAVDDLAEWPSVQRLFPENLLQWFVHVDGIEDRVAVRRDVKERIRVWLADECLVAESTRLDDRVEPVRLDPLVDVGILVGHARLDGAGRSRIASAKEAGSSTGFCSAYHAGVLRRCNHRDRRTRSAVLVPSSVVTSRQDRSSSVRYFDERLHPSQAQKTVRKVARTARLISQTGGIFVPLDSIHTQVFRDIRLFEV